MANERHRRVDWAEVRGRISRAQAALDEALEAAPRRALLLLEERAAQFAQRLSDQPDRSELVELLTFELGPARYSVESRFVCRVARLRELVRVPDAAPSVLGLTCVRGELLPVMDLPGVLGEPEPSLAERRLIVILGTNGSAALALAVDRLLALVDARKALVGPALGGNVTARTEELGSVLDGAALLLPLEKRAEAG